MWHSGRYPNRSSFSRLWAIIGLRTSESQHLPKSTKQISGIVKDQAGIPVIGANVIVKGTTNGVITGLDGDFLLEVPENAILEISYIGYMTQSIPINGKTTFNIILEEDTQKWMR